VSRPSALGMSRDQNKGSLSAARPRRPWRGGREGASARSATWTAAATSRAVSASTTMFRRSRTRRTTCPACGSASCGPTAAGEGPVASGSVTPGTVRETALAGLLDTPALRHVFQRPASCDRGLSGQKLIMSRIVRFATVGYATLPVGEPSRAQLLSSGPTVFRLGDQRLGLQVALGDQRAGRITVMYSWPCWVWTDSIAVTAEPDGVNVVMS
jgi:hypothetical protein